MHVQQLREARKEVQVVVDKLAPDECVLTRDFVNHYDYNGEHVKVSALQ